MRRPSLLVLAFFCSSSLFGACKSDDVADEADGSAAPPVAAKEPATLIEGDAVTIPAVYQGVEPGMSVEEAKKRVASLPEDDTIKDPAYPDIYFVADVGEDGKSITRLYFALPNKDAKATVSAKWGEPLAGEELGRELFTWFNPKKGLRASLKPGFGEDWDLEITHYRPYREFLGEGAELAFASPAPLLGADADTLRAAYPEVLIEKTQEDADADRKQLEAMVGDKAQGLGAPKPSMHLEFGPTEYEKYWTRVNLSFDDEGKVRRFWFTLPWELNPAAKDEMMGFFESKWGKPQKTEELGEALWVFGESPRIEIKENTISKGWDLAVEAAQP